jgi:hypothetical protein
VTEDQVSQDIAPATLSLTRIESDETAIATGCAVVLRQHVGEYLLTDACRKHTHFGRQWSLEMRAYRVSIMFCACVIFCHAQGTQTDQALLTQVREKYDAPFNRNLRSFNCAVDFSWKDHFTETFRVGDEGTDEELEKFFQPIRNRVEVTRQRVTVSSGLTDDAIGKLPHGGMAEFLLEHAVQKSLSMWLPASTNTMLPDPATPVSIERSSSGYSVHFKMQSFDVEMVLDSDMRLQRAGVKASPADHYETSFAPGPQGFVLTSWTMGEDGNTDPGHRLIFSYTYQNVAGMQLPEHVSITRESHHEVWRYKLSDCIVKTSK